MTFDTSPLEEVRVQHGVPGEPETGNDARGATLDPPPFAEINWEPPARFARSAARGVKVTLMMTPTVLLIWILAPDDLKYELRKQARWLPWFAKYAAWWLRKQGW